jgi:ATP-dependent 26S proteasome regulatory subunit
MQECNMVDIDGLARELDRFSGVDSMAMCDEADTEALTFQVDVVRS